MLFRIFTLYPQLFHSFLDTSLIARNIKKNIIDIETINWRENYSVGGYKSVDDRPFGGGHGMVLSPEPIYNALKDCKAMSQLFDPPTQPTPHLRIVPNNKQFYDLQQSQKHTDRDTRTITIMMSPRGYPITHRVVDWLSHDFDSINIVCGRFEGFDSRVTECVDIELSIGNFVVSGGEIPAMALIEAVSRLIPGFVTKRGSIEHESFAPTRSRYREQMEYIIGKNRIKHNRKIIEEYLNTEEKKEPFDEVWWRQHILPYIEHPMYTRPEIWSNWQVPTVLLSGDHKKIDFWRNNWYKGQKQDTIP